MQSIAMGVHRTGRVQASSTRLRRRVTLVLVLTLVGAGCGGGGTTKAATTTTSEPTPAVPRQGIVPVGRENVAFFYQQINRTANLSRLGAVKLLVAGIQNDGAAAVARIHEAGAKAYRYVQSYWFPNDATFDGLDIGRHPDWAFCSNGNEPKAGRTDRSGTVWWFLDMNEQPVRQFFVDKFRALKAEGWDGVFLDRGYASLTGLDSYRIADDVSTCTGEPAHAGATFADAYVEMVRVAKDEGLPLIMNYGVSPFDAQTPLRPDSKNPACIAHDWAHCPTLGDVWDATSLLLDESVSHPRDARWDADFAANLQNEQNAEHGGRVIGLLTTATVGSQDRESIFYGWTRAKLFAIPIGVNTGDRGCTQAGSAPCNRHASYPELANVVYGAPVASRPESTECAPGDAVHCLWLRRYQHGMSLLNVSEQEKSTGNVDLGVSGCRYVFDLWTGQPLAQNKCVTSVSLTVGPWEGHPLQYATNPF
jgi:hypothetical protein